MMRHLLTMSPDLRFSFEFVEGDDECAILHDTYFGHATEADGGGELQDGCVDLVVARGGVLCYIEFYQPDADIALLRARREKLRPLARRRPGAKLPIEPLPVEHTTLRFTEAIGAGDWNAVTDMLDPRLVVVDHCSAAPGNRESFVARLRAVSGIASRSTVFAASDSLIAGVLTVGGDAVGAVMDWQADRCGRMELFDADDEAGMLVALDRLRTASAPPASP
jgi:hypothetical protein